MKLPNADRCVIERQKLLTYLLNASHPENGGKAAFFATLGFHEGSWETFAQALRQLALSANATECVQSAHGQKFIVDGELIGPTGRTAAVRTVWIVDLGEDAPRLVTAYPD